MEERPKGESVRRQRENPVPGAVHVDGHREEAGLQQEAAQRAGGGQQSAGWEWSRACQLPGPFSQVLSAGPSSPSRLSSSSAFEGVLTIPIFKPWKETAPQCPPAPLTCSSAATPSLSFTVLSCRE